METENRVTLMVLVNIMCKEKTLCWLIGSVSSEPRDIRWPFIYLLLKLKISIHKAHRSQW